MDDKYFHEIHKIDINGLRYPPSIFVAKNITSHVLQIPGMCLHKGEAPVNYMEAGEGGNKRQ